MHAYACMCIYLYLHIHIYKLNIETQTLIVLIYDKHLTLEHFFVFVFRVHFLDRVIIYVIFHFSYSFTNSSIYLLTFYFLYFRSLLSLTSFFCCHSLLFRVLLFSLCFSITFLLLPLFCYLFFYQYSIIIKLTLTKLRLTSFLLSEDYLSNT